MNKLTSRNFPVYQCFLLCLCRLRKRSSWLSRKHDIQSKHNSLCVNDLHDLSTYVLKKQQIIYSEIESHKHLLVMFPSIKNMHT